MQPWKNYKTPETRESKKRGFAIFRCEQIDFEKELNDRFEKSDFDIQHVARFGSACEVVIKFK